jgi:predicted lactoylglutathione lyase
MHTLIQTPTPSLQTSLDFYTKLGFKVLSKEHPTLVGDEQVVIEINEDRYARAGIKLFSPTWESMVKELKTHSAIQKIEGGYLSSDPSGVWVYLIESTANPEVDLPQNQRSVLGNYAGISLESISIPRSMEFWKILGFSKNSGDEKQGWVSLVDENGMGLSIMNPNSCPHLFFNPSFTYFNGRNNPAIIQKIRDLGIPITEEITHFNPGGEVENIIIRDPGGFGIFLFND